MNRKKAYAFVMSAVLTASVCPVNINVFADDELIVSGDYAYTLNDDDTVCLEEYRGSETAVTVPETLDGHNVTSLGKDTYNNTGVTSVSIGDNIVEIGENTFTDCYALTEFKVSEGNKQFKSLDGVLYNQDITVLVNYPTAKDDTEFVIPSTVETIGTSAIYETKLKKITFPESLVTIERHGVSYNAALNDVDLSKTNLVNIEDFAFSYCTSLDNPIFPESLTYIGGGSFAGCSGLAELNLPENLTDIGQNAFAATALKSVTIPASVTEIGYCAFGYDENLEAIPDFKIYGTAGSAAQVYCTESDEDYEYSNNFTFIEGEGNDKTYDGLESSDYGYFKYAIVDGEAYITYCDFAVDVPEIPSEIEGCPVTKIYGGAFYQGYCSKIVIPDSGKMSDSRAFSGWEDLKEIVLPEGLEEIKAEAFSGCTSLERIIIPASCKIIGDNAFANCTSLVSIEVADGNTAYSSDGGILFDAEKETLVKYPLGIKSKSYKVPDSVKTISEFAFLDASDLTSIDLNNVTEIKEDAFSYCTGLKSITIPDGVTALVTKSDGTFAGCTSLETVKLGKNMKSIGEKTFDGCTSLKKINFPKKLEVISDYAFYDCSSLKKVRLGDNITEIGASALGFIYDSEQETAVAVEGFKIYANKNTKGAEYAENCGLECVTNTYGIFGVNVNKGFAITVASALAAGVIALIAVFTTKKIKKNSAEKQIEEAKKQAALAVQKRAEETENSESKID